MTVFHQNVQNFTIVCKSCLTHVTLGFATWGLNRTLNSCGGFMILEKLWKPVKNYVFVLNWKIIVHRTQ